MECSKISECDFDSGVEREHAYFLECERQMERIKKWKFHLEYSLIVNGKTFCIIIPDFTVYYPNGRIEIHEIKGGQFTKTKEWSIKRKLFIALYPHITYRTLDRFKKPKRGRKPSINTWDKKAKRWVKFKPRVIQMEDNP